MDLNDFGYGEMGGIIMVIWTVTLPCFFYDTNIFTMRYSFYAMRCRMCLTTIYDCSYCARDRAEIPKARRRRPPKAG
jgi:hypothetical protein